MLDRVTVEPARNFSAAVCVAGPENSLEAGSKLLTQPIDYWESKIYFGEQNNNKALSSGGALVRRAIVALVSAAGSLSAAIIGPAFAQQSEAPLKIGLLTDFSSVYSHIAGVGDLEAAKMAIEDFGGVMFGKQIELVSADPLNKPDIAA